MSTPPPEKIPKPGVNISGGALVNPYKLAILAEELGIPYNYITVDFSQGEHKFPGLPPSIPNGRLPALVHVKEDGTSIKVFESGACMMYLVSEFDTPSHRISYPPGTAEYWTEVSWLSWQTSSYGPIMGQGCHFNRYYPGVLQKTKDVKHEEKAEAEEPTGGLEYGSRRFTSECRRLTSVLEDHLASTPDQQFTVPGDKLTTADIAIFLYAYSSAWCGLDIDGYPRVKAWIRRLVQRPAFHKGLTVPMPYMFSDAVVSSEESVAFLKGMRKFGNQMVRLLPMSGGFEVVGRTRYRFYPLTLRISRSSKLHAFWEDYILFPYSCTLAYPKNTRVQIEVLVYEQDQIQGS